MLGAAAVPAVQGLVGQSLLAVRESALGVRYRMLETVREFGRMRLTDAGEDSAARAALRRWAVGYARAQNARLTTASSSGPWTRWPRRTRTSPTSCAARSPTVTRPRWSS